MKLNLPKILSLAVICAALAFVAALAGPEEDVDFITGSLVSEATYAAAFSAKKDEISREIKTRLDFSDVSERDFDVFLELFVEKSSTAMVVGLRKAFRKKLLEMPAADIVMFRSCLQGRKCSADDYSAEGMEIIKDLPRFGKMEGQRIGQVIGTAILPELIEMVRSNTGDRFENPEAVLQVLNNEP